MSGFFSVLEAAIRRQATAPAPTPFADAVAAFESQVAWSLTTTEGEQTRVAWATELGVAWPCTPAELRRAFRRRAFETHPDRAGGSHEAFLRVQSLLAQGCAALDESRTSVIPRPTTRYSAHRPARPSRPTVYA